MWTPGLTPFLLHKESFSNLTKVLLAGGDALLGPKFLPPTDP